MADNKLALDLEVKGVEQSISSIKDLKNAIKQAKDEQVKMASSFGEGSKEYITASKNLAELKDKMDDLNDSTQSLKGSGVESLSSSFGMLGDGLKNLDFDKVKTGFKGIGSAMNAVPLLLLVTGITMLMEKFDLFGKITEIITNIIYAFTDAIGLTNKADEELSKNLIENSQKVQKRKEEQYDAEIKKAQASGQNTKELEIEKLKVTEDSIAQQVKSLEDLQTKKGVLNAEEQKQYEELQSNLLKASGERQAKEIENEKLKQQQLINLSNLEDKLRVEGLSAREKEIDAIKKQQQALREELNKNHQVRLGRELEDTERWNNDVKKINELTQKQINEVNAKYYKADLDARNTKQEEILRLQAEEADAWWAERLAEEAQITKEEEDAKKAEQDEYDRLARLGAAQDEQMKRFTDQSNEREKRKVEEAEKEKALRQKTLEDDLAYTKQGLQATQQLTDLFFAYKLNKHKGDAKAELEIRKKQFNVNKAFGITTAVIDGIGAVQKALNNPYPLNIVLAAISGIAAAANVAKIASTKFDGGGASSGGGGDAPATVPIPTAPTINTPQANTNSSTTFDETGKKIGGENNTTPTIKVNATVGVNEIAEKSNRVNVLESQSKF